MLSEDDTFGTITIAEPIGIICGIVPTTNPTSTAIFKSLISLKTRNAIIFSPHPRAKDATNKAADIVLQAAIAAGAPKDLIGWIDQPSVELSNALMHHPDINLITATGGHGMVKAAYSSGKPAIGVGAGNTPVVIDETADIKRAVASVLMSKPSITALSVHLNSQLSWLIRYTTPFVNVSPATAATCCKVKN